MIESLDENKSLHINPLLGQELRSESSSESQDTSVSSLADKGTGEFETPMSSRITGQRIAGTSHMRGAFKLTKACKGPGYLFLFFAFAFFNHWIITAVFTPSTLMADLC